MRRRFHVQTDADGGPRFNLLTRSLSPLGGLIDNLVLKKTARNPSRATNQKFLQEDVSMNRQMRSRDEGGRFMSDDDYDDRRDRRRQMQGGYRDDDDDRSSRGPSRQSQYRERDEYGRFMSDDDNGRRSGSRERDEQGRFMSDDDNGHRRSASQRYEDDDGDRRSSRGSAGGREHGGWFGDSERHAMAARRGWEERYSEDDDRRSSRGRSPDDDYNDDRRMPSRSRGATSRSRDDDEGRGWYGDPQGHAEAARKGWEHREGQSRTQSGSSYRSRSRDDDDDDRRSSSRGARDQGHGGWFGDPRGHAEAARRGWENR
jgi:hypothetical protein